MVTSRADLTPSVDAHLVEASEDGIAQVPAERLEQGVAVPGDHRSPLQ
jgi:hypothetical protein